MAQQAASIYPPAAEVTEPGAARLHIRFTDLLKVGLTTISKGALENGVMNAQSHQEVTVRYFVQNFGHASESPSG